MLNTIAVNSFAVVNRQDKTAAAPPHEAHYYYSFSNVTVCKPDCGMAMSLSITAASTIR